jgi:transcriptional regulator with XRE-family HTH domain
MMLDVPRVRAALGCTQAQLADRIGVHLTTVTGWEAGRFVMRNPTRMLIETILRSAGHNPSDFYVTEADAV